LSSKVKFKTRKVEVHFCHIFKPYIRMAVNTYTTDKTVFEYKHRLKCYVYIKKAEITHLLVCS